MVDRLFKWMVMALFLAAVVWHYRDTETVRQRRTLIESVLSKVGMDEASVRRYWPLEGQDNKGLASPEVASVDTPASPAPSAWDEFVTRYNPITLVRDQIDPHKPATTP